MYNIICELKINNDQDESINCTSCLHFKCTGLKSNLKSTDSFELTLATL